MIPPSVPLLGIIFICWWLSNPRTGHRLKLYVASVVCVWMLIPHLRTADGRHGGLGPLGPTPPSMSTSQDAGPPEPFQGDIRAIIEFIEPDKVAKRCNGPPEVRACQSGFGDDTLIVAPNPCEYTQEAYAWLMCHELGHVNGWRHPQ